MNRAEEPPAGEYRIAGKHCESGDVLIEAVELPEPHAGDVLAVPATGAYTLALGSTYNGVPRPAAVLVENGGQRLIRTPRVGGGSPPIRVRGLRDAPAAILGVGVSVQQPPVVPVRQPLRRLRWLVFGGALVVGVAVGGAIAALRSPSTPTVPVSPPTTRYHLAGR